jgi:hypothetical protein
MSLPSLILTLKLDQSAESYFQNLRIQHYPPSRNQIPAHISLFHYLPGEDESQIEKDLKSVCQRDQFSLQILPPKLMGAGVMFPVKSPELEAMHATLKHKWQRWLKPQDLQGYRPHIVVQNKVSREIAQTTLINLNFDHPFSAVIAEGLLLWEYQNGPWCLKNTYQFHPF